MNEKLLKNLKLLSINDLKNIFNISKTTAYRIVESRKIPFYKISGVIRFSEEDIINYLKENKIDIMK
ncbi:helix-turn-helix domain-containing protein [Patescibacteria group bacterium]|nr:helix-turn-helix domain-containing protein [Patescibacteria group bacterium]